VRKIYRERFSFLTGVQQLGTGTPLHLIHEFEKTQSGRTGNPEAQYNIAGWMLLHKIQLVGIMDTNGRLRDVNNLVNFASVVEDQFVEFAGVTDDDILPHCVALTKFSPQRIQTDFAESCL
jgi:hypothetical protein